MVTIVIGCGITSVSVPSKVSPLGSVHSLNRVIRPTVHLLTELLFFAPAAANRHSPPSLVNQLVGQYSETIGLKPSVHLATKGKVVSATRHQDLQRL